MGSESDRAIYHHHPHWGVGGPAIGFLGGSGVRARPRRGDVRLAVLALLAEQPMHGYQIITELSGRSGGSWRPSPGSIYPTLQQLEEGGFVTVSEQDGRRTFSLTASGRADCARASAGRRAPWEDLAEGSSDAVRALQVTAQQVMDAAMQVAAVGNDLQLAEAERLLGVARRSIYRILAEDDGAGGRRDQ